MTADAPRLDSWAANPKGGALLIAAYRGMALSQLHPRDPCGRVAVAVAVADPARKMAEVGWNRQ